ncbi:interleukin-24 [Loxodonta africana]|uniref:Interleukin 24 n=1 Tax=Loxodonta africana TaxID=9785 RepID=G3TAL5_LOXAF|nr:interleukin-24 [Loxodonta africana]XP_049714441.1 interleukin-24 [Elephas maximus indicus]
MGSRVQMATLPCLSVFLLLWSQVPRVQGQEFRFGPCRVQGVELQGLRRAFWTMKDTVQAQDHNTSVRLLRKEILQNISDAESCYFIHSLLGFYMKTVFKNYYNKANDLKILQSFSTLANNFIVISSKLQPSEENEMFSVIKSAHRQFLQFQVAFKKLDIEAALTKALGELDILLTWMEKYYQR